MKIGLVIAVSNSIRTENVYQIVKQMSLNPRLSITENGIPRLIRSTVIEWKNANDTHAW